MSKTNRVGSSPVRDLLALTARPEVISFAGGLPAPELFDVEALRTAFDQALSRRTLQYAPTEGDPDLRARVAERLTDRGLPTGAEDLVVTTGSQQALTLAVTALLEPGSVVAVEEPTYLAALQAFRLAGARVVPVPGDNHGIDPDALAEVVKRERPTMLYLVPTFANPTGRTLTADRRARVAALADRHGLWVVEDDPYSELRYRGNPLPPLAAHSERVLHVGSFSKIGAPGLRLGWLRGPAELLRSLVIVKQAADLHTSTIDQAAAAVYLGAGDIGRHIAGLRAAYRERRDAMIRALPSTLPPGASWSDPDGGMFVWVELPDGVDTGELLPKALAQDVAFVPGAPFYATTPNPSTMRLSFTTNTVPQIEEGMRRLATAFH
ncbi:aminotransferase-like domain-containing protein [Saccharothrix obliqua]|uniref:aminotransferase-like domain-containing protein n=1 Tax=Saccharothrix obliqua TaxID=2861747 RepID=UPI001C5F13DF|nr:PLP-dependent aminotransferase family protein [Saccharothrix obliqua]MBW4719889.1 PLP-dependent aminotransferase family protein [Saccharothrix obliqua]